MSELDIQSIIDFTKDLASRNIENAYKYLIGLYEENKNYLEDKDNLKILLLIIEYQQKLNLLEDLDYFFKKALEYAIKYKDNNSLVLLYNYYCQILYKSARLNKCELLIENFYSNLSQKADSSDLLKLKEIGIAISSLLKENIEDEQQLRIILNEKIEPARVIKIIVSICRKYISSLNEIDILNLVKIFKTGLEYIFKNKEFLKSYHSSFAELHNLIGNLYYHFGLFTKSQRHFLRAFMESLSNPDVNLFVKFQKNISISFYELGEIEKANKYFFMIEKLYKKIDDPIVLNQFYSVLGLSYIRQGRYSLGHSLLKAAIKYRMSIKDYFTLLHTLNYAIIFSLERTKNEAYYYFLYFEKIITQLPDSYYYLYYILYLTIFRKKKFDSKLFLKKLLNYPIYSLRLISLFSLCLKYKIDLIKNPKFLTIILFFRENFKNEISEKHYKKFADQFYEFKDIIKLKVVDDNKISTKLPLIKIEKNYEIDWNKFISKDFSKYDEETLLNMLYLKLLEEGTEINYKNNYYQVRFKFKNDRPTDFNNWVRKALFSRINLEKIILFSTK